VLVMNLRLLGFGLRRQPLAQVWRDTRPWLVGSLTVMLTSGILLFTSEAVKLYYHEAFWVKMLSLLLATLFTFTVMRKVALAHPGRVRPLWGKTAALISTLLWTMVGVCGRWIGFS
jgi:hypothetical protein